MANLADNRRPLKVAVDFDGTIVDHRYPDIGEWVPGAKLWLQKLQEAGALLILNTMRSNAELEQAVAFLTHSGIRLYGINGDPDQTGWTTSPKVYGHVYIDDAALGCPLRSNPRMGGRDMVDWDQVGPRVMALLDKR